MRVQHWLGFWLEMMASRASSGSFRPSSMNSAHWGEDVQSATANSSPMGGGFFARAYRVQVGSLLLQRVFVLDDGL